MRRDVSERRGRLAGGAAVLALGSVVAKLIGAFHRVPLTNILGAGGMGVYQLVFPVYALFITLSTAGIPTALSRLVAEHRARGEDARKYLAAALFTLIALSVLAGVLIVALSHVLARWQGNPAAADGYVVIAPAVVFSGIVAGLRGWFQGEMRMAPTALSAVIEQLVKLGVGVGLAALFAPRGMTAAVLGALAGVTVSEAVAAAYLFVVRAVERRRGEGARGTLRLDAVERGAMFRTAAPIALLSVIIPLGAFSDTFIVVNALKWGGADTAAATAMYGLYCGPVTSLVNLPVAVAMALAVAVVPSVSVSRAEADLGGVLAKSRMSVKLVYLVGVPSALFLMVFGRNILSVLYPTLDVFEVREAARLLSVAAFGVVLAGSTQIYVSLLQALDRTKSAVKSLFAAVVVKAVLSVLLVRFMGVMGAAVAGVVMSAVSLLLVSASFHRFTEIRLEKNVAQTLVCGVIMALAALVVREYVPSDIGAVTVGAAVCLAVYGWLTMLAGVFTEQECLSLPFGSRLAKLRRKIRFWENGYDR